VGLTLLVSGTGKLPGQTEFVDALLKSFWTPTVAYFIGYCLPLAFGFMAINSWVLINGVERFPECATCFGIWEEFLGALVLDVVLFCLALIVLLLHKESFLTFQPWFIRRKRRKHYEIALRSDKMAA